MVWAWSVLLLDWWPPPAIKFSIPDQSPLAEIHLTVGSCGPPLPCPLAALSSSSAQWCSVSTTPSRGLASQLRQFSRMWRLVPAHERLRRWMRTRVACSPYQVECSCQTTKALSLSRAPYTPDWIFMFWIMWLRLVHCFIGCEKRESWHIPLLDKNQIIGLRDSGTIIYFSTMTSSEDNSTRKQNASIKIIKKFIVLFMNLV